MLQYVSWSDITYFFKLLIGQEFHRGLSIFEIGLSWADLFLFLKDRPRWAHPDRFIIMNTPLVWPRAMTEMGEMAPLQLMREIRNDRNRSPLKRTFCRRAGNSSVLEKAWHEVPWRIFAGVLLLTLFSKRLHMHSEMSGTCTTQHGRLVQGASRAVPGNNPGPVIDLTAQILVPRVAGHVLQRRRRFPFCTQLLRVWWLGLAGWAGALFLHSSLLPISRQNRQSPTSNTISC